MSIAVSTLVWANGPAKAADRLMMLAIADNADDHGLAWPGMDRLAAKCCVKPDAARSTVRRLEADGWVSVRRGGGGQGGHGQPNRYQLNMARLRVQQVPPVDGGESVERTPPSTREDPPVDAGRTPPSTGGEPSTEPPENHHGENHDPALFIPPLSVVQSDAVAAPRPTQPKKAHQLPETFRPSQAHVALAAGLGVNLRAEWPQFVDHHRARGSAFKDWDAALRTWVRNAARFAGTAPAPAAPLTPAPRPNLYG